MNLGRVGIVVAARTASSRLPSKALLPLGGLPMIVFMLRRLRGVSRGQVVLATTELTSDDHLAAEVAREGVPVFRGDGADLVTRYVAAARHFGFDTIVRLTGDCPFLDAATVDGCIASAAAFEEFDLATTKGTFPIGLDAEIFRATQLAKLNAHGSLTAEEREHLTLRYYDEAQGFVVRTIAPPAEWLCSARHFTVDTPADYAASKAIVDRLGGPNFSVRAMLEALH